MENITITHQQLEIAIQNAISKALNIKQPPPELPDRCTFKEALEITDFRNKKSL